MKKLISIICSPIMFYSVSSCAAEADSPAENQFKEIVSLEPNLFDKPPMTQSELELLPLTLKPKKSSFLTVGFSSLIPGLGHAYLGDYKTAASLFGSFSLFRIDLTVGDNKLLRSNYHLSQNTWLYNVYAAYRDVRAHNGIGGNYSYDMPMESLADLAWAPFQWSVLKKTEVWGGLLGALTLAAGLQYLFFTKIAGGHFNFSSGETYPLLAFPVGLGEEAFFRGFLQSSLSEVFNPWWGIALSSLAFGVAHVGNSFDMLSWERQFYYCVGLPFITSSGLYFGWLTYKNRSLKESIAMHAWYDFVVFLANYSLAKSIGIQKPSFSISIPF